MGFCPQGAFLRQRLGDKGIGPVKAQLTAVEGRCHGLLIHQRARAVLSRMAPGFIFASASALTRPRVWGVAGQCRLRTSHRLSRVS